MLVALAAFASPSLIQAQETGHTVSVNLATCTWTGSTPDVVIDATDAGTAATARDCVDGWTVNGIALSLDGEAPDARDANAAVWNNVPDGTAVVVADGAIPDESALTFEVAGEDVTVWATYYNFASEEVAEETSASGGAQVTSLPNTGSGVDAAENTESLMAMLIAVSALAAGAAAGFSRRRPVR